MAHFIELVERPGRVEVTQLVSVHLRQVSRVGRAPVPQAGWVWLAEPAPGLEVNVEGGAVCG